MNMAVCVFGWWRSSGDEDGNVSLQCTWDVVALTDEAGKVVASYAYGCAWGNVLSSKADTKANPYGYAGYTYDAELGEQL
ncbi:hypothetical protein UR08_07025 [Listeria kieliensis]|uniref:Uncharacterized protein n=1 Tax=Listeria kieliensis TaxID=1621700 RepID=A0A3D8TQR9_9LIST|nr:hypothetical protein [Listeria kieliensis]RDX00729.1 hypothetical protein UR08_07025 [Listeria kieliensis]